MSKVLLVLGADGFQNVGVRDKLLRDLDAEGLDVHFGIVKGDVDVHVPEITPVVERRGD